MTKIETFVPVVASYALAGGMAWLCVLAATRDAWYTLPAFAGLCGFFVWMAESIRRAK